MLRKKIKLALKDDVLDQHCQNLKIVTEEKQLFRRPNFSLRDLSNEVGISVNEVKKILSERMQITFFEFITGYKVNEAKKLLRNFKEDQFSISAITFDSGFNTIDSFKTIFKQYTQMSPEEYRTKYFIIGHNASASFED